MTDSHIYYSPEFISAYSKNPSLRRKAQEAVPISENYDDADYSIYSFSPSKEIMNMSKLSPSSTIDEPVTTVTPPVEEKPHRPEVDVEALRKEIINEVAFEASEHYRSAAMQRVAELSQKYPTLVFPTATEEPCQAEKNLVQDCYRYKLDHLECGSLINAFSKCAREALNSLRFPDAPRKPSPQM